MDPLNPYAPPRATTAHGSPQPPRGANEDVPADAIFIEGTISKRDALTAFRSVFFRARKGFVVATALMCAFAVAAGIMQIIQEPNSQAGYWITFGTITSAAYLWLMPHYQTRAAFKNPQGLGTPHRRTISREGVESASDNAHGFMQWTAFLKYRRLKNVTLLFLAGPATLFFIVPRSMFQSEADWQRFHELVEANLPPG